MFWLPMVKKLSQQSIGLIAFASKCGCSSLPPSLSWRYVNVFTLPPFSWISMINYETWTTMGAGSRQHIWSKHPIQVEGAIYTTHTLRPNNNFTLFLSQRQASPIHVCMHMYEIFDVEHIYTHIYIYTSLWATHFSNQKSKSFFFSCRCIVLPCVIIIYIQ